MHRGGVQVTIESRACRAIPRVNSSPEAASPSGPTRHTTNRPASVFLPRRTTTIPGSIPASASEANWPTTRTLLRKTPPCPIARGASLRLVASDTSTRIWATETSRVAVMCGSSRSAASNAAGSSLVGSPLPKRTRDAGRRDIWSVIEFCDLGCENALSLPLERFCHDRDGKLLNAGSTEEREHFEALDDVPVVGIEPELIHPVRAAQ